MTKELIEQEVVGYGVKLPQGMYGRIYTHKHEAEDDFKNWKHIYPESKVIPLYTNPQPAPNAEVLAIVDGYIQSAFNSTARNMAVEIRNAITQECK